MTSFLFMFAFAVKQTDAVKLEWRRNGILLTFEDVSMLARRNLPPFRPTLLCFRPVTVHPDDNSLSFSLAAQLGYINYYDI